jgi:1-aminocyclopropane-1-carboxylate deaminase/D-cysteine desulfhydrase-like pyridoxal-dependent ACC family enzyme
MAMRPLSRFPLAALPTPLIRAERLERALGGPPLWIKRDDLTGFALAGNKARKLEYTIGDALDRGSDVVVTGGGPRSNHCRGTAAACRAAGLACVVVLYGAEPASPGLNLSLIRSFGADVRFTGDPDRASVDHHLEREAKEFEASGRRPYVLPRGGATPVGARAYATAAEELSGQLAHVGVEPAAVIVATGSGGTQAGLVAGAGALGLPWRVIGAAVSRPPEESRDRVLDLARGCADLLGASPVASDRVEIVDARGASYRVPSDMGTRAARVAAATEGLLLDPVFTAKAMGVLIELVESGLQGPAVFVHTGGEVEAIEGWSDGEDGRTG